MTEPSSSGTPRTPWSILLTGPALATVHFLLVYLVAEAACTPDVHAMSSSVLRIILAALTGVAAAVLLIAGWRALRMRSSEAAAVGDGTDDRRFVGTTGLILLGLFAYMLLLVAAPILGATLC